MATPLAASYRFIFPIDVDGIIHNHAAYVSVIPGSGASGYDLVMRDGTTGLDASAAVYTWWGFLQSYYEASQTVFGTALLQHLSGIAWLPIATIPTIIAATGTAAFAVAGQATITLRDTAFHKVRSILLESAFPTGDKFLPPNGVFDYWTTVPSTGVASGWNWQRGRSNLFIGSAVSLVTDLNDKVRRRRGTA
jgi:hypothetical protein